MSRFYDDFWTLEGLRGDDFKFKWPTIKKYIPQKDNLKILDYGCGAGPIMKMMFTINSKSSYIGIDISKKIIKQNTKRMPQFKFFVLEENKKLPFKNNFFDFIISNDVIEHVYDTTILFKELFRILKPEGKILLTTPYHGFVKNLLIILTNNFDLVFNPTGPHIRFFTKRSLSNCLKKAGFIPQEYKYYGRFYPISRGILVIAKKNKK